jgi:hypothetical protein
MMTWCLTASAVLLGTACVHGATAVRVLNGAPRLEVDGKPVRGRMFWGAPGRSPIRVTNTPQELSLEFTALMDEPTAATMHLRFGQDAGTIVLDDLRVVDLDSGREVLPSCGFEAGAADLERDWTYWPKDKENTVATVEVADGRGRNGSRGLVVSLREPAGGKWPDWHLYHTPNLALQAGHRYRVTLWIQCDRERHLQIAFYRPGVVFTLLGAPSGAFEQQIRLAAEAGVDFVSFPCPLPWPEPGKEADWSGAEAACRQVLGVNPKALLLPRIGMHPPAWWLKAHPDAVMLWEDGPRNRHDFCVASPEYRTEAAAHLGALVRHLESTFGESMAGYHPCGQNTGEWFYQDSWGFPLSDYSAAMRDAWRRWLGQRYGADAALQQSWAQAGASLATAEIPAATARHAAPAGVLRDPRTEQALIDFAEFQQEAMAECICVLAKAVREASAGKRLVVFFYGYVFEFGAIGAGPANSGHYGLRRALECPDIDVLCSPISYWDRGLGQSAPSMTAAESVALAGKLWLREDDTATHLSSGDFPGWREKAKTPWETTTQLQRNVAQEALRNQASWWMDLGATGWFNDPGMWAEMKRLDAIDRPLLETPTPFVPEVAAILDERSMLYVAQGGDAVAKPFIYEVRTPLGRFGAPYGQYLLDDALAGRVPAKLKVFLNAWRVPAATRQKLLQASQGSVRVWCYAPGYLDENGPSPAGMRELTGFELVPAAPATAWAEPTERGRALGLTQGFGVKRALRPLFAAAAAAGVQVLATYPDGSAAVALREGPEGASIFVGAPGLTAELLRAAARLAGVHLFTEADCNVYANGPFVALHAAQDGALVLNTGSAGEVMDVLSGAAAGQGPRLNLTLRRGDTRILELKR